MPAPVTTTTLRAFQSAFAISCNNGPQPGSTWVVGIVFRQSIEAALGEAEQDTGGTADCYQKQVGERLWCHCSRRGDDDRVTASFGAAGVCTGRGFECQLNRVRGRRWSISVLGGDVVEVGSVVLKTRSKSDHGGARGDSGNCARNESGEGVLKMAAAHWNTTASGEGVIWAVAPHKCLVAAVEACRKWTGSVAVDTTRSSGLFKGTGKHTAASPAVASCQDLGSSTRES